MSVVSHVVALGVVFYYMIAVLISDSFLGIHLMDGPSGTFFGFLVAMLVIEIGVTVGCDLRFALPCIHRLRPLNVLKQCFDQGYAIERTRNLCAEIERNEFFARGGGRV